MFGKHRQGSGHASRCSEIHGNALGFPVYGSYNVDIFDKQFHLLKHPPALHDSEIECGFWLFDVDGARAWAVRSDHSKQAQMRLEFVSKLKLSPNDPTNIEVTLLERYDEAKIQEFIRRAYHSAYHHSFTWSPRYNDNDLTLPFIRDHWQDWSRKTVLDLGCNMGYYGMELARVGAVVTGVDLDVSSAREINDHIEMLDCVFIQGDVKDYYDTPSDVKLYLSVHHQLDPHYNNLAATVKRMQASTRDVIYIELIMPPKFGTQFNFRSVDWEVLHHYKHKVRGERRIFAIPGNMR